MADIKELEKGENVHKNNYITCVQSHISGEGVDFQLGTTLKTFRGTITLVAGDNLGSQFIGGYKQLGSALRKCRYCMAVSDDMQQI